MEAFTLFAEKLADRAGEIARAAYGNVQAGTQKADKSLVTDTDKAIEAALSEMIASVYPDHGIFGEELGRTNPDARYQWVIDPIDGTNAFIAGIPTFTTLVALCDNEKPVLGIIDQPISSERWVSSIITRTTHATRNAPLFATTSTDFFTPAQADAFARARKKAGAVIRHGDAYLYGKLASGHIDVVIDAGLKPYDFAALMPIVEAAGGVITDWDGKPLTLASNGEVIACREPSLHRELQRILAAR